MPSITVTNEPVPGYNLIQINWSDIPTVLFARVIRITADGTEDYVRVNTSADPSGQYIELSAGLGVIYDAEAPMDVPVSYRTEGLGSATTVTTSQSILMSGNDMWLKDPLRPWADKRLTQDTPNIDGCVPESGIFFAGMDTQNRPNRTSIFTVNNARLPIPAVRVRGSITTTIQAATRRFVDRDGIIELNAPGNTLFFQSPAQYGMGDTYNSIGEYEVSRLSNDHKQEWRLHSMPMTEVGRPAGLGDGVLGTRWCDICLPYATFGDATAAGITWTDVALGQATQPPFAGFRLYSDIPVDFATYGAIPSGGRTYEDLLEDR